MDVAPAAVPGEAVTGSDLINPTVEEVTGFTSLVSSLSPIDLCRAVMCLRSFSSPPFDDISSSQITAPSCAATSEPLASLQTREGRLLEPRRRKGCPNELRIIVKDCDLFRLQHITHNTHCEGGRML
eukprot:g47654.t1